jgi:hypothetical protein
MCLDLKIQVQWREKYIGIETIFSPISKFYQILNRKTERLLGSEEDISTMMNYLCSKWGIDPATITHCSTMMGTLEAFLNWGGRIPLVCNITGVWRMTIGLVIGAASFAIGSVTMAFSKDEESSLIGRTIIKQYAIKHGLGNSLKGIQESTSWTLSIMANLPRDLLGLRCSYEGETVSRFHLTPMLKGMLDEVKKKLSSDRIEEILVDPVAV